VDYAAVEQKHHELVEDDEAVAYDGVSPEVSPVQEDASNDGGADEECEEPYREENEVSYEEGEGIEGAAPVEIKWGSRLEAIREVVSLK